MKKKKCLFIDYLISNGASKNRLDLTMQGFRDNDFDVKYIYILKGSYRYIIQMFVQLFRFFCVILKMGKGDLLYVYGEIHLPFLISFTKIRGLRVFHERTEYPVAYLFPEIKSLHSDLLFMLYKRCLRKVDVFVTCSSILDNYYRQYFCRGTKSVIIPFLVDLSKFSLPNTNEKNIITYCGYMGGNKDNLEDLIEIFCSENYVYENYKLVLIGDAKKDEYERIKEFAKKRDTKKKIEFTGRLEHKDVIDVLMCSTIHVLVRSDIDRNKGGFPSKLAEYLATSKASIVSQVGELSLYLKDNHNIFFVQPNNNKLFASTLSKILKEKERLIEVGKNGRAFVEDYTPKKQIAYLLNQVSNNE